MDDLLAQYDQFEAESESMMINEQTGEVEAESEEFVARIRAQFQSHFDDQVSMLEQFTALFEEASMNHL